MDNSKENVEPSKQTNQDFEADFVMTFTCTYKVSCKASIDTLKKNTTSRSISSVCLLVLIHSLLLFKGSIVLLDWFCLSLKYWRPTLYAEEIRPRVQWKNHLREEVVVLLEVS